MTRLIVTTLTFTGVLGCGELALAAATPTQTPLFTASFDQADAERFEVHGGLLSSGQGRGRLTPSSPGRAVALAKLQQSWSSYRVCVRARSPQVLEKGQAFGLVAHALDPNRYYLFRLVQKRGGLFAELLLQSDGKITLAHDFLVGDLVSLSIDSAQWHELTFDVDGTHVAAALDGKPLLTYSFAGRPPADYPHPPAWARDLIAGMPGLYCQDTQAEFADFRVIRPGPGASLVSPLRPPVDSSGMIQPRRTYDQIIRDVTAWTLSASRTVELPDNLPPVAQAWDPILLVSYVFCNDEVRGVSDMQYPGHNHPPTIMGLIDYYLYSGDEQALAKARQIADWNLRYTIPAGWKLAGLPLSHFDYRKLASDGSYTPDESGYEPDKAANTGLALVQLYAVTQEEKYLTAARQIAEALLRLQFEAGNFPFRVNARSGEVEVPYTCSIIWYVQFLDSLMLFSSDAAQTDRYRAARDRAFDWLIKGPVQDNNWRGFYGDIASGADSLDQWTALDTAMYLIDSRQRDPRFVDYAGRILAFVHQKLVTLDGFHPGVPCLVEQTTYPAVLSHHVIRLADTYARLYGARRDPEHARLAQLIANSSSWLQKADGKFAHGLWYHAQGNAYILNFVPIYMRIMAELPQTAPDDQNHLLRYTTPLKTVRYGQDTVELKPWAAGKVRLKLTKAPAAVEGAGGPIDADTELPQAGTGWRWNAASRTLDIAHADDLVVIRF
ncbi:hypothetical protein [Fontivita pretiosa]|uniref:hypothetical protein n=1 Tax=Fontivita pretiosa TaxID=2989684 RepID=UPI003D168318